MPYSLVDRKSYYWTGAAFLVVWAVFYREVGSFVETLPAALMSAAIFWISYTLVRWLVLAIKS